MGARLAAPTGCRLVVVRVGDAFERVFRPDGTPEANYRPSPDAASAVARLALAADGDSFAEDELDGARAALRSAAVVGPEGRSTRSSGSRALAPWLAGAAFLLVLGLGLARAPAFQGRRIRRYYPATET